MCREPCLGAAVWQAPQRPQRPDADHVSPTLRGPEAPLMRNTDSVRCRETCTSLLPCFSSTLIFGVSYPRKAVTLLGPRACVSDFYEISFLKRLRQWTPHQSGLLSPRPRHPPLSQSAGGCLAGPRRVVVGICPVTVGTGHLFMCTGGSFSSFATCLFETLKIFYILCI